MKSNSLFFIDFRLPESMLKEHAGTALTIPMPGEGSRSLNLSTAVAIVLYEGLRQLGI